MDFSNRIYIFILSCRQKIRHVCLLFVCETDNKVSTVFYYIIILVCTLYTYFGLAWHHQD